MYSVSANLFETRSRLSKQQLLKSELVFVPLHPKKIQANVDYLWRQWNLRNTEVNHKLSLRSKQDSKFNRMLNLNEVDPTEDIDVAVRAYASLYSALYGFPKGTFVTVGYYVADKTVRAHDDISSLFLVSGKFQGVVLLEVK